MVFRFGSEDGFCDISEGKIMKTFKAAELKIVDELNCRSQKVNSSMNIFPIFPDGILKIFLR